MSKTSGKVIYELTDDLPAGFTKLAYVTLKNQLIDTGEKTNKTTVIEAKMNPTTTTATYLWYSDSSSSGSTNTTAYCSSAGNWRFGSRVFGIGNATYTGAMHEFKQSEEGVWIDGSKINSYASVSSFTSSANLRFGSSANTNNRFTWFRHTRDGAVLTWHVACKRDSDNAVGFYDLVSDTFTEGGSAPA